MSLCSKHEQSLPLGRLGVGMGRGGWFCYPGHRHSFRWGPRELWLLAAKYWIAKKSLNWLNLDHTRVAGPSPSPGHQDRSRFHIEQSRFDFGYHLLLFDFSIFPHISDFHIIQILHLCLPHIIKVIQSLSDRAKHSGVFLVFSSIYAPNFTLPTKYEKWDSW